MTGTGSVVRVETTVETPRERAFDAFVDMTSWWPRSHHTGDAPWEAVVLEPSAPGRWFERDANGVESPWGRVLAYEPPARLLLDWQLGTEFAYDAALHTNVEVTFHALAPDRTRVELAHDLSGYGEHAARMAEIFTQPDAWQGVLDAYGSVASRG